MNLEEIKRSEKYNCRIVREYPLKIVIVNDDILLHTTKRGFLLDRRISLETVYEYLVGFKDCFTTTKEVITFHNSMHFKTTYEFRIVKD